MNDFESILPSYEDCVRNLRREPWSKTGLFMTLYDLRIGDEWVRVEAHDTGTTIFDYPDGTRIIDGKEDTVTLHSDRSMTVADKEDGRIENYSAATLDGDAAAIADAIREAMEGQAEDS